MRTDNFSPSFPSGATPTSAVALSRLRFQWPRTPAACLAIDALSISMGDRVFLHGPSGSGKSTLLGLIAGVLAPNEGQVQVLGTEVSALSARARDRFRVDHIGFIFQQFNLVPHLPVMDNVLLPCRFSKRRSQRASSHRPLADEAARLLERLGIDQQARQRSVSELSVGQQQRVAAARALIGQPELIIADEPTSALDAARQSDFLQLLLDPSLTADTTVLFVSHDMRLATHFSRVISLPDINLAQQAGEVR